MDEPTQQPKVFANRVILQLVQHMLAEDMVIEQRDYLAIRVVFRKCGGSWQQFEEGAPIQFELLKAVVTAWGQMPERTKASDQMV
jgi:hypothetical protein